MLSLDSDHYIEGGIRTAVVMALSDLLTRFPVLFTSTVSKLNPMLCVLCKVLSPIGVHAIGWILCLHNFFLRKAVLMEKSSKRCLESYTLCESVSIPRSRGHVTPVECHSMLRACM